jgi:hypothetical protein
VQAPSVFIQGSGTGWRLTGLFRWCDAAKRAVHAMLVVIGPESIELPCQVGDIPEEYVVQILPPDCTDQPFHERMRARDQGQGLDFVDFEHAQVGPPAVKCEQRIVVEDRCFGGE